MLKVNTKVMTYLEFAKIKPTIGLDSSFNVGSTEAGRWKMADKTYYIESVLYNMATQSVIIVDIEKCLENSIPGSEDYRYFKRWNDDGYSYIAVDGNNRSITIHEFYQLEKIYLNTRKRYQVELNDGRIADFVLTNNDNIYSKLPQGLQDAFNKAMITVNVVERATRREITELFLRVNSGIHLNGQEKRNAILSAVSDAVRNIGFEYDNSVGLQVMGEPNLIRFGFHELVASGLVFYTHQEAPITINSSVLDRAYADNSAESNNLRSFAKIAKLAFDIIADDKNMWFKKNKFKKFNLMNWFILICHLNKINAQIKDKKALLSWFVESENRRLMSAKPLIVTRQGTQKIYSELQTDDSDKLIVRSNVIIKDFTASGLLGEAVIILDNERIFSDDQRRRAWERQNGVCPLSGKEIPLKEVLDASKWQADHIKEFSVGGKTSDDNLQLVCAEAHKQKTRNFVKGM